MKLHRHLICAIIEALDAVFLAGGHAAQTVENELRRHPKWGSRDRKLFSKAIYDIVRWWRKYTWLADVPDGTGGAPPPSRDDLWLIWAAWWLESGNELPDFPELEKLDVAGMDARGREMPDAVRESVPDWLNERASSELGEAWPRMLTVLNEPADVIVRVNALRTSAAALIKILAAEGIAAAPVPEHPNALRLTRRYALDASPAFRAGLFEVQDTGSQAISPLLEAAPGMLVIDACAGAGGKSLHLACLMKNKGRIIAMDVHQRKLDELQRRAARSRTTIIRAELVDSPDVLERRAGTADRLLLDVPCSGLGVLRRSPDIKWKLTSAELDRLCLLQQEILTRYSAMLKAGGKLVYATCSILPCENEKQVSAFLAAQPGQWAIEEELRLPPAGGSGGNDGFYAVRLVKREQI